MLYRKLLYLPLLFFCYAFKGTDTNIDSINIVVEYLVDLAKYHKEDRSQSVPIVAIGGCPGVGKTHLSKILLNVLQNKGTNCVILPLDHFILSPQERKKIETLWDVRHFNYTALHKCLFSIFSGENIVKKPICNQFTGEIGAEVINLTEIDLILFEGLYASCSKPPLNFFDYCIEGIFLEADESDIYNWRWERELKKTEPKTKQQFIELMEVLFKDYHQNIKYSKKNSIFMIKKNSNHSYSLEINHSLSEVNNYDAGKNLSCK